MQILSFLVILLVAIFGFFLPLPIVFKFTTRKKVRVTAVILSLVVSLLWWFVLLPHYILNRTKTDNDINNFHSLFFHEQALQVIPEPANLPEHLSIFYQHQYYRVLFWPKDTVTLIVEYDEIGFEREKAKLDERTYLDRAIHERMPQYEFRINSFDFRILNDLREEIDDFYPKQWGAIAMSDEKKKIAYLYHHSTELDIIRNVPEYIKRYFRYDW